MKTRSHLKQLLSLILVLTLLTACGAAPAEETVLQVTDAPTAAPQTEAPTAAPTEPPTEAPTEAPTEPPMPEDETLPLSQVPEALPDPAGVADLTYEAHPTFADPQELSLYFLNQLLNGNYKMDFYLTRELAPDSGTATVLMHDCLNAAMTYYLFGAYNIYSMYIEDEGDPVLTHLDLRRENPDYDLQAQAKALEFVRKHPVPIGGFQTFEQEMEYARLIHDDLIRRITYDPIGFSQDTMLSSSAYTSKQEAYNVLVAPDGMAVCAAYARGFALIAHYAGINCAFVTGNYDPDTDGSHAWNILYPCDGSAPVLVDVTWDDWDENYDDGEPMYAYSYFYRTLEEDEEHMPLQEILDFLYFLYPEHAPDDRSVG